jgi:hypothetical protein
LDTEKAAYDDESDYSNGNNDSGYTSAIKGGGRDIFDNVIDCEDGDFIGDSDNDDDFECDSDKTDNTVPKDTADCYTSEVNDLKAPVRLFVLDKLT